MADSSIHWPKFTSSKLGGRKLTLEQKKARIREIVCLISDDEESAVLFLRTPSLAFAHKSPQSYLGANDEAFIDLMLGVLERSYGVLRDEFARGRMLPMSTAN